MSQSKLMFQSDAENGAVRPDASGWVPVFFARNREEAERYLALLGEACIPAVIGPSDRRLSQPFDGTPILVSSERHERASEIIVSRDALNAENWDEDDDAYDDEDEDDDEDDEFVPDDDDDDDDLDDDDGADDDVDD